MKILLFVCITVVIFVIQSKLSVFGIPLALTVTIPYYIGLRKGEKQGLLIGSLIGMIEDSLSGNILGPHFLGKGIVGFSASLFSGSFFRWTPILGILGIFTLTVIDGLSVFLTKTIFNIQFIPAPRMVTTVLVQGLLNTMAGIFLRPENAE